MKILPSDLLKIWDHKTMEIQNLTSIDLMNRAANLLTQKFLNYTKLENNQKVAILCGVGNNGGDGLVMANNLSQLGFQVEVFIIYFSENFSEDFKVNLEKCKVQNLKIHLINDKSVWPNFKNFYWVIDAVFGYGLSKPLPNWLKEAFYFWNNQQLKIIAIDVPSGLFLNQETEVALKASHVLTIQQPKLNFFFPKNYQYVPSFEIVDIGSDENYLAAVDSQIYLITDQMIDEIYAPKSPFSHKGTNGHLLIIGGSLGKIGAVHLASKAAFKSGCGLVTAWVPKCGVLPLQSNFPELMILPNKGENYFETEELAFEPNAMVIGPGWSASQVTSDALNELLPNVKVPVVFDADALNILAENKEWYENLPNRSILTPHPKELERLIGIYENDGERLEATKLFSKRYDVVIVLKNARTIIVDADLVYLYPEANPKLAKAGSGDVLSGIIGSLLAQGYQPLQAAVFGVYLHAQSAKLQNSLSVESFLATDIISGLNDVFVLLNKKAQR
jgi:hydroxyethylthiazole kinase-like uncharacterized protein yjeF